MAKTIKQKIEALKREMVEDRSLVYSLEKEIMLKKRMLKDVKNGIDEKYNKLKMYREL